MHALLIRGLGMILLLISTGVFAGGQHLVTYTSKQNFETVKSAVHEAITDQGLVISTTSHIGEMLERTGKDLGNAKPIFLHAESYEFCSASVSRLTMQADPHNIVFCPYIISVYVLTGTPSKTYISFRKPQPVGSPASKASLKAVEKLLRSIIEQALQ